MVMRYAADLNEQCDFRVVPLAWHDFEAPDVSDGDAVFVLASATCVGHDTHALLLCSSQQSVLQFG